MLFCYVRVVQIKLYSLLVDPKWHDGLEFFTAEKQRRSESMISGPSKSSNDIPMGSQGKK